MEKKTLSCIDVAHILDMTPDDIATLARKGVLRGEKKGRQWRFTRREVTYLAKKTKGLKER